MAIPYGMGVGVTGIVALFFKQYNTGLTLLGAAAAILSLAVLSLRTWSQQKDSRLFTTLSAGASFVTPVSYCHNSLLCMYELDPCDQHTTLEHPKYECCTLSPLPLAPEQASWVNDRLLNTQCWQIIQLRPEQKR